MRVSSNQMSKQLIAGLQEQQAELSKLQQQLSSGKKILKSSDNPIAASSILALNQSVSMMERYSSNINSLESRLSLEETVLQQQFEVITQIKSLIIRANSGAVQDNDKKAMGDSMSEYIKTMSELANTKDSSGEFLFSGYQASTKPFEATADGYDYFGDAGIRFLQTGFSSKIQANDSGEIFSISVDDNGNTENVFSLMKKFANKLSTSSEGLDDFTNVQKYVEEATENIIATRSSLGNRLTSLDAQRSMNNSMGINLEESRANLRDLDYAEAITKLTAKITSLQAAQKSYAKISQLSLFSYIN
jgi:flagellar hook-associated protein 3 FlgL